MENFSTPVENFSEHHCEAAVLKCVDFRFTKADIDFIRNGLHLKSFDLYGWPGAGKQLIDDSNFRQMFANKIKDVSVGLHRVTKLVLLWHWDCGGYGGSKSFASVDSEELRYQGDLKLARKLLQPLLPAGMKIVLAYSTMYVEDSVNMAEYTVID